jgi:hypothetical protein
VTSDGATLYVAAFGSSVVGVFDTALLENDTFTPDATDHITVTGGGPSGLVLNEAADRLYVATRFDNGISVIDTGAPGEIAHLTLHNPEPAHVVAGRPVLYDARLSSSNGEASCASCHVFADFDSLAWDLGNPDDTQLANPNPFAIGSAQPFHPMKGPMTTQSLRGMANHGPMHWRGDRTGGSNPGGQPLDENAGFNRFIVAFEGLLGNDGPIATSAMQSFADFILEVTYPPNPVRSLDDSLNASEDAGRDLFFGPPTDGFSNCDGCHTLNPGAGFFGSNGLSSIEGEPQEFKIPHLRNMYQKIGMFGMPAVPFFRTGDNGHKGNQVRGFGFFHDGSVDTMFRFHGANAFSFGATEAAQLADFMHAFDSDLKPIVGQQVTLGTANATAAGPRITLLITRAAAGDCELTVKGVLAGEARGWLRLPSGVFQGDRTSEATLTDAQLRAHAATAGQERTYLCVPPGSGTRVGVDRDEDGFFDRDELDAGSDPADPSSIPPGGTTTTVVTTTTTSTSTTFPPGQTFIPIPTRKLTLKDRSAPPQNPRQRKVSFSSDTRDLPFRIIPPFQGSSDDPTSVGATVVVYNSVSPGGELVVVALPAAGWRATGPNSYKYKGASTAAITRALFRTDRLSFKGGKEQWPYTLNETQQGRVAVAFFIGNTFYCSDAPGKVDRVDRFIAVPKTPAPPFCVAP